jgi:hypothetical protein
MHRGLMPEPEELRQTNPNRANPRDSAGPRKSAGTNDKRKGPPKHDRGGTRSDFGPKRP